MSDNQRMNISDEAVEAAAKPLWEPNEHDDTWASEFPTYKDYLKAEARKVLEAAAPYLMAQAWDEGGVAAIEREHTYGREEKAKYSNPYRSAGAGE
jgi:hypothetical protein